MRPRRVSARQGAKRVSATTKVPPRACTARAAELRGARPPKSAPAVVSLPLRRRWGPRRRAASAREASTAIAAKFCKAPVKSGRVLSIVRSYAKTELKKKIKNRPTRTPQIDFSMSRGENAPQPGARGAYRGGTTRSYDELCRAGSRMG